MHEITGVARLLVFGLIVAGLLLGLGTLTRTSSYSGMGELLLFVLLGIVLLFKK